MHKFTYLNYIYIGQYTHLEMCAACVCERRLARLLSNANMQEELTDNMEFWATSPDIPPMNPLTEKAGDFR